MKSAAVRRIVRYARVAPVLVLMFYGCTCSESPQEAPPAPAPTEVASAPQAPAAAEAPAPDKPHEEPQAAAGIPTPASSTPVMPPKDASKVDLTDCEQYVAALSGQNPALLKDPGVTAFAPKAAELLTCLAVKNDSRAMCDPLIETSPSGEKSYLAEARDCFFAQSIFHEARAYPKGTSFTFTEIEVQQCDNPKACGAVLEATRTGDETKCAQLGPFQSICRAFVKLDTSLCRVEGKLPARQGDADAVESKVEEGCRTTIDTRKYLARGLKAVAESGSGKEKALAQAALGQADACKEFEKSAIATCVSTTAPGAAPANAPEPPPPAAAPAAPAAEDVPTQPVSPPAEKQPDSAQA